MKKRLLFLFQGIVIWLFASCTQDVKISAYVDELSPLAENYADIIVPPNMAPLNFFVDAADGQEALVLTCHEKSFYLHVLLEFWYLQ